MQVEREIKHMFKKVQFQNFRGFQEISVSNLTKFNLISGKNNTGKTAFLEGLFLLAGAVRPNLTININSFRGLGVFDIEDKPKAERPWDSAFWNYDTEKSIKLLGIDLHKKSRTVTITAEQLQSIRLETSSAESKDTRLATPFPYGLRLVHEYGKKKATVFLRVDQEGAKVEPNLSIPMPAIFVLARTSQHPKEDAQRFGKLQVVKGEQLLLDALRTIEPRLKGITAVPIGDVSVLHGDIGAPRLIPLPLMGGGTVRLTSILLAIADAPKGVVFIDEIENGFHHTVLPSVWQAVRKLAMHTGTQIFATTHSLENIRAAHQVFKSSGDYSLSFYRLDRKDSEVLVRRYGKEITQAAFEADLEMR